MWPAIAIVVFTVAAVFDYHWLKTFAWPIYLVNLGLLVADPRHRERRRRVVALDLDRAAQFQFSELAKILMIIVLANYLAHARQARLARRRSSGPACSSVRRSPWSCSSPTWGPRWSSARSSSACSSCPARACAGWPSWQPASSARPDRLDDVLRDYQKAAAARLHRPVADTQGAGYQLLQSQIAVGSGGLFGKGLTNGSQAQRTSCRSRPPTSCSRSWPRSSGSSAGSSCSRCSSRCSGACCVTGWRSKRSVRADVRARASRRCSCSSWSSTSGWSSGSCRSRAFPCPLSPTAARRSISLAVGLGHPPEHQRPPGARGMVI